MLRCNAMILILFLALLRKQIIRWFGPAVMELCWLLLAVRLLLPETIFVKIYVPVQKKAITEQAMIRTFPIEWRLAGCGALCAIAVSMTILFYWRLKGKKLCLDNEVVVWKNQHPLRLPYQIYTTNTVSTPVACGMIRPQIVLPQMDYPLTEREFVLLHEWTHLRRGDLWKKRLLLAAAFWNWYNPMVWLMLFFANRDIELCCDECATHNLPKETKKDYARFLLDFQTKARLFQTGFTGGRLQERIVYLMQKPRKRNWCRILAAALLVAMCTITT